MLYVCVYVRVHAAHTSKHHYSHTLSGCYRKPGQAASVPAVISQRAHSPKLNGFRTLRHVAQEKVSGVLKVRTQLYCNREGQRMEGVFV